MKVKSKNGIVTFIMKAGKDIFKGTMPLNEANKIIENGNVSESRNFKGYDLCVDDKFFFPLEKRSINKRKTTKDENI